MKMKNLSVRKKLTLNILILTISLLVAALIALVLIVTSYNKLLYQSVAMSFANSAENISADLSTIEALSSTVVVDETVQSYLSRAKDTGDFADVKNATRVLYNTLTSYYQQFNYTHISYMGIYNDSLSAKTYVNQAAQLPDDIIEELTKAAIGQHSQPIWITKYSDTYGLFVVREIRRINRLDSLGVCIICVDVEAMTADAAAGIGSQGEIAYMLYSEQNDFHWSKNFSNEAMMIARNEWLKPYEIVTMDKERYFAVKSRIDRMDWNYVCFIKYNTVYNAIITARNIFIGILVFSSTLAVFLSFRFITSLTRHLDNLMIKIKKFGEVQEPVNVIEYDYSQRQDEFGAVHQHFDDMVHQISTLINVNYRNELLKKEAELKTLEMQINPHFLYNTLESINWLAKGAGVPRISEMTESLGRLLSISLDQHARYLTIENELEFVRCYITIQNNRFEEQLDFSLQIESENRDEILRQLIPKLAIQPLVENAIHYGLEEITEICRIIIHLYRHHNSIWIDVKNSGSQFEEGVLAKLKSGEVCPGGFGIGLLNIDSRLKLSFGPEYGIWCFNEEEYAVARIKLPLKGVVEC